MKAEDLNELGIPNGPAIGKAFQCIERARALGLEVEVIRDSIRAVATTTATDLPDDPNGSQRHPQHVVGRDAARRGYH